jgi:hypothetical protein
VEIIFGASYKEIATYSEATSPKKHRHPFSKTKHLQGISLKKNDSRWSKNYRRWSKLNCLWYKTLNVRATFFDSASLITESFPKWMAMNIKFNK